MPQIVWLIVAFLAGLLIEWLLEIFFFRRRMFQQIDADKQTIVDLRAHSKDTTQVQAQLDKVYVDLQVCSMARDNLQAQSKDLETRLAQATSDAQASANAQTGLEKELSDCKAQLAKANASSSATMGAHTQLDADLKAREAEIAKLHADLDGHLTQNKNLAADVTKFTAGAATATATVKALEGDKAGLAKQVADLQAQLGRVNADLNACQSARALLETNLKARDAEITKLHVPAMSAAVAATPEKTASPDIAKLRNRSADDETPFETPCPQHLSDVKGIGTVFETRLYEAGVGSYWGLAQLSNDDLKRFLKLTDLQARNMVLNAVWSDARRLAKETKSLGRKWTLAAADDFEPLTGIGQTFEKRLYDAGICTYESLAQADVQMLDEICQAPAQFKPDYAAWIREAKSLAAKKAKRGPKA
jgi:predicted flap endonuclease-1-like 5' DNA nuclease